MVQLSIPPEFEQGFVELRQLREDQVRALASALKDQRPTLRRSDLRRRVGERVSDTIAPDELSEVLATLYSLYPLRDDTGQPMPDVVDAICDAMDESYVDELHFSGEDDRSRFKGRLLELLDADSLDVTARATDLLWEHERTVHGKPRVLTDIRPVFAANLADPPRGAMIMHTLKLDYHEDGQVKEFFITLDAGQVDDLVGVLVRANVKANSLKQVLANANIPRIDVDGEGRDEGG